MESMVTTRSSTNPERRREHQRIHLVVPATVRGEGHTLAASTRDISEGGLFLFTDAPFQAGADIEIVLMLPRELGLAAGEMVCCHGTVVRVEVEAGRCGIAAKIERIAGVPQV
jgi:PilZ domain-containing protein